jgi:hypothetical protein
MHSIRLSAVMTLFFPLAAAAGDMIYREGTLIQGPVRVEDSWVGKGTPAGVKAKNWVFVVKVGDYTFTGYADRVGGIFAGKGPQGDEWPANATLEVVFHTRAGSLYMDLKSPSGKKEDDLWVFSKKGADGKELCGRIKCKQTAEDSPDPES